MDRRRFFLALALGPAIGAALWLAPGAPAQTAGSFFFRDGDRVVMIGDSITEQLLHSNYVEIYTVSRFPQWKLAFRNVGIGGDTSPGGNRRTARDVLSFKPTAVTVTFGMNDGGYGGVDQSRFDRYIQGLQGMLDQILPAGARVALLSSSPVEKKEDGPALEGYDQTLERFAAGVKELAAKNKDVLFVDQFHPHLAALQKARDELASLRINGGDAVHPGPSGQLLMAWAILKGLNAPSLVSRLEVNADSGSFDQQSRCKGTNFQKLPSGVAFDRADEALPCYVAAAARSILEWAPIVQDLDRYMLRVTHLPEGNYILRIDSEKCATVSAADLAGGYNMALLEGGPIAKQAKAVYEAVFAKNKYYHDQIFRGVVLNVQVPDADKAAMIEERMKGMAPLQKAISDALVMKPHRFELAREG